MYYCGRCAMSMSGWWSLRGIVCDLGFIQSNINLPESASLHPCPREMAMSGDESELSSLSEAEGEGEREQSVGGREHNEQVDGDAEEQGGLE